MVSGFRGFVWGGGGGGLISLWGSEGGLGGSGGLEVSHFHGEEGGGGGEEYWIFNPKPLTLKKNPKP